jgi:hypothetical protein
MSEMTVVERAKRTFRARPYRYTMLVFLAVALCLQFLPVAFTSDCDQECLQALTEFNRYEDAGQFIDSLERYYRRGSPVEDLTVALRFVSESQFKDKKVVAFPFLPLRIRQALSNEFPTRAELFEIYIRETDVTSSRWKIAVLIRDEKLLKLTAERFFEDEDFSARRMPLRIHDFNGGDAIEKALSARIQGDVTKEKIERLMNEVGANGPAKRRAYGSGYWLTYTYKNANARLIDALLPKPKGSIGWLFDKNEVFQRLTVTSPSN